MENELLGNGRKMASTHLLFLSKQKLENIGSYSQEKCCGHGRNGFQKDANAGNCAACLYRAPSRTGTTARCPPRNFLRRLSETVNFDQGVAGGVVYAGNYRGVATGCQGGFDGRFGIVWRGQPGSLDLCLLSALPIVVGGDARPVAIAQVQKWIRQ